MSTQAIEIRKETGIQQWKSPAQIKARIQAIQQLMETTLKKDVDYGIIPGMAKGTKPSLWKPGSEQILAMFQIAVDPQVEDLSNEDCFRYRVTTRLTNTLTGEFLGAGIGEASTNESKYKWRRTYSQAEFEATPEDRRRIKFGKYNDGSKWVETKEMQVRQEPADLANTILKMAKKRSQIDATLTVTGASSMFEQDLEDLPEETREEMSRNRAPRQKKATPPPVGDVVCASCGEKNGHDASCQYAQPKKPEPLKWLVQVEAVDEREAKDKRKYLMLTCINVASQNVTLYCWHTGETWDRIMTIKPKTRCIFIVKPQPSGNKTYYSIESIVEITGEQLPAQGELMPPE